MGGLSIINLVSCFLHNMYIKLAVEGLKIWTCYTQNHSLVKLFWLDLSSYHLELYEDSAGNSLVSVSPSFFLTCKEKKIFNLKSENCWNKLALHRNPRLTEALLDNLLSYEFFSPLFLENFCLKKLLSISSSMSLENLFILNRGQAIPRISLWYIEYMFFLECFIEYMLRTCLFCIRTVTIFFFINLVKHKHI